jgi:hypothetical protein
VAESVRDSAARLAPKHRAALDALVSRNEAFVKAVLAVSGKQVFVDTSKNPRRFRYLFKYSGFDVRVVLLIRDVRGSVASQMRHIKGISADQAAKSWARGNAGIERVLRSLPEDKHTRIKYEDFCRNPEGELQRLYRFFGVDPTVPLGKVQSLPQHHIIGNSIRMRTISQIKLDERWRQELDQDQLRVIDQVAGHMSHSYGY